MATLLRIVIGVLLVAHGLVHLLYLTPDVPNFSLDRSWLVPETASRPAALVLMWATGAALARCLLELVAGVGSAHRPGVDHRGGNPPGVDGQDRWMTL